MTLDLANWMGSVDPSKRISDLSIPGTHDSASRYIDPTDRTLANTSIRLTTQTTSIAEQLNSGIRFLDIRVGYTDNQFELYHEGFSLNLTFGEVRDTCKRFLQAHPRETIIMSLKKEDGAPSTSDRTFRERFTTYVNQDVDLWFLINKIPKLGRVRGKIVLFRRFALDSAADADNFGIDASNGFPDDRTGTIGGLPKLVIQDKFRQDISKQAKWELVQSLLVQAKNDTDEETLYLNFGSAAGTEPVDFPLSVSNFINPRLLTYFAAPSRGRFGIVAMDFQTAELGTAIVRTNGIGG